MDVASIPKASSPEALEQKVRPLTTEEPHLPKGRAPGTVQPLPMPVIGTAQNTEHQPDEGSMRLRAAQSRSDITGTGGIVDVIV